MLESGYLNSIIGNLGIALVPKSNQEIIVKNKIEFNNISKNFEIANQYDFFYQEYGTIIIDFLNTNFKDKLQFKEFFSKYSLFGLENKKLLKIFSNGICSEESYNLYIDRMFYKYKKLFISYQKDIDNIISTCLTSPSSDLIRLTPFERLCIFEYLPNTSSILHSNKMSIIGLNTLSNIDNMSYSKKDLISKLINKEIVAYSNTLYIPSDLSSLIKYEITGIINEKIFLKKCNYCNKYFIAPNNSILYCSNIAPGYTSKTCKQIGRNRKSMEKKKQDEALYLYMQVYNNKAYKASRYKDITTYSLDYKHFQQIGKKKVKFYKEGKLSKDDFIDWINRNS